MTWDVLDLGPEPESGLERWAGDRRVQRVVRLPNPAPSGRRLGSRALGLGLDALRVAIRARLSGSKGGVIAMNPWTTVAARLVGLRAVATVGLYAVEGGRSWRLLRRVIGTRPVVTLSAHEASRWRAGGGLAASVKYGATFPTLEDKGEPVPSGQLRIFIGGSSDRDQAAISRLIEAIEHLPDQDVRLVVAVGDSEPSDDGRVQRHGAVTPSRFGELIRDSDVVFLPLADNGRAVGHMVMVEALQRGKPVVANWVTGMAEYFDDTYVLRAEEDLLAQLKRVARSFHGREAEINAFWRQQFAMEMFGQRILDTLDALRGTRA